MIRFTRAGALVLALGVLAVGWADDALAAATITLSPTTATTVPNIGKVAQSLPATSGVFRVDATTGNITVASGTLQRIGAATTTTQTFTVNCVSGNGAPNRCGVSPNGGPSSVTITVSRVTSSGSALLPGMNVSAQTLGTGVTCTPSTQNQAIVTLSCNTPQQNANNQTSLVVTFKVGMDIQVGPTATPTGLQTLSYTVSTSP